MIQIIAILFSLQCHLVQAPELDFLQEPMTTQAVVNTTVQFSCLPSEQVDQIVWMINDTRVSKAPFPPHISTNTIDLSLLNVYAAPEINGTIFQCIARKGRELFPSDSATLTVIRGNFSGPKDIIAFRGQIVQMHCVPNIQTSYFVWLIDEATIADSGYSQYITFDGNYTLNISSADVLASKRFQCAVQINGIRYYSGNATVLIQGELDGVRNVHSTLNFTLNRVTIQWERPFTLQVTNPDGPIMWFEIVIQEVDLKITNVTDDFVHISIGKFSANFSYTYIITSWNKVGRGNSTTGALLIPPSSQPSSPTVGSIIGGVLGVLAVGFIISIVIIVIVVYNHRSSRSKRKTTFDQSLISNNGKEDLRHKEITLSSVSFISGMNKDDGKLVNEERDVVKPIAERDVVKPVAERDVVKPVAESSEGITPDARVEENIEDPAGRDSAEGKKDDDKALEQPCDSRNEFSPFKDTPKSYSPPIEVCITPPEENCEESALSSGEKVSNQSPKEQNTGLTAPLLPVHLRVEEKKEDDNRALGQPCDPEKNPLKDAPETFSALWMAHQNGEDSDDGDDCPVSMDSAYSTSSIPADSMTGMSSQFGPPRSLTQINEDKEIGNIIEERGEAEMPERERDTGGIPGN